MSVAETLRAFNEIDRIRAQWLPNLRIIYTVSPMPVASTFRPVSAVTANAASKAIVRAALDEFLRSRPDDLNRTYFYYPGYEIVTALLGHPLLPDNRHLHDHAIDIVLSLFARTYTTQRSKADVRIGGTAEWLEAVGGQASLAGLERRNIDLQRVCDERLVLIEQLKAACDERLVVIEQLKAACDERREIDAPRRVSGMLLSSSGVRTLLSRVLARLPLRRNRNPR
jgi:hypothetical protein